MMPSVFILIAPSGLAAGLAQNHRNVEPAAAAIESDLHGVAAAMTVHHVLQILLVLDLLAVNGHDQIAANHDLHVAQIRSLAAAAQAGALSTAAGNHLQNEHAVIGGQAHLVGKFRPDGQSAHAQAWPAHRAIADKVADDRLGDIDGDSEPQTGALAGGAENKTVDANDVAARVQ